jgi:hypothetical protein
MRAFLIRYATPFTVGLFLVSVISGIALFFHVGGGAFHGMHEWLSMLLIVPFVLHLWRNWRPFSAYFKRVPMALALALSVLGSLAFAIPTGGAGRVQPPQRVLMQAIANGSVAQVAPLFGHTPDSFTVALRNSGFTVSSADQRLTDIAEASGKSTVDLIGVLAPARPRQGRGGERN